MVSTSLPATALAVRSIQENLLLGLDYARAALPAEPAVTQYRQIVSQLESQFATLDASFWSLEDFGSAMVHSDRARYLAGGFSSEDILNRDPYEVLHSIHASLMALPGKEIFIPDVLDPPRKP